MGRLAGLELKERWGGWDKSAFSAKSGNHVAIFQKMD